MFSRFHYLSFIKKIVILHRDNLYFFQYFICATLFTKSGIFGVSCHFGYFLANIPIRDIPVIKDSACLPDPTRTEVNVNKNCTPSIMHDGTSCSLGKSPYFFNFLRHENSSLTYSHIMTLMVHTKLYISSTLNQSYVIKSAP